MRKRILVTCLVCLLAATGAHAWTKGKAHKWGATATHGGAAGAMDTIAGVSITANDTCQVFSGQTVYNYYAWVSGSTALASEPDIVCPDDINVGGTGITGTTLWVLADSGISRLEVERLYVDGNRWDDGSGGLNQSLINQHAGTDITADLEEEAHATEHESGGADAMQLSDMASGVSDLMDKTGDAGMISNWDTAYGWGDHAAVGYLTGTTNHAALHAPGGDWTLSSYYLTGTTNHAALHQAGGDWELHALDLAGAGVTIFEGGVTVHKTDGAVEFIAGTDIDLTVGAGGSLTIASTAAGGGSGGSGLTTFRTGPDGSEAESATIDDAPGGMFLMGNESGVSPTASGNSVFFTTPKTIAFGWATNGAGMSGEAGVSTAPIRVRWDCLIERVTVSSVRGGANSGVSVGVFYNASAAPNSGETIFNVGDVGKPGSSHAYSKNWISGGTQMATGGYIAFMPHTCGSGVTRATITIDVRTLSDGN